MAIKINHHGALFLPPDEDFLLFLFAVTMAVPPTYADLGKSAKDIFSKGFGMLFSFSVNILNMIENTLTKASYSHRIWRGEA